MLINKASLSQTVDAINAAHVEGRALTAVNAGARRNGSLHARGCPHGASHLRSMRDDDHGWRKFPFWYTVLALSEMENRDAKAELTHAAPALERAASRAVPSAVYARRRHDLAARALNRL